MSLSVRNGQTFLFGWLISANVHLALLLVLLLVLLPIGRARFTTIQLTVVPAEAPGADLILLDFSNVDHSSNDDALEFDVLGDMNASSLEISHPHAILAGGQQGDGRSHASAGSRVGETGGSRATFFGTVATGDRFVYILDISGSMDSGTGKKRMFLAFEELQRSVEQLASDQLFHVFLFSDRTRVMFDAGLDSPSMLPATIENKRKLTDWLQDIRARGDTNPRRAIAMGLTMQPSAIFLLSDGEFDPPEKTSGFFGGPEPDVSQLVIERNVSQVPIHTIAFEDYHGRANMATISKLTDGEFRFVAKVPSAAVTLGRFVDGNLPISERRAAGLLRTADFLKRRDNIKAEHYYGRIRDEYPFTKAAATLRARSVTGIPKGSG